MKQSVIIKETHLSKKYFSVSFELRDILGEYYSLWFISSRNTSSSWFSENSFIVLFFLGHNSLVFCLTFSFSTWPSNFAAFQSLVLSLFTFLFGMFPYLFIKLINKWWLKAFSKIYTISLSLAIYWLIILSFIVQDFPLNSILADSLTK